MTQSEHRKALLLAKIDAQRTIFRLELRVARSGFRPLHALLSLLGVEGVLGSALSAAVDGGGGRALSLLRVVALVVASVMSLFGSHRERPAEPPGDPTA